MFGGLTDGDFPPENNSSLYSWPLGISRKIRPAEAIMPDAELSAKFELFFAGRDFTVWTVRSLPDPDLSLRDASDFNVIRGLTLP